MSNTVARNFAGQGAPRWYDGASLYAASGGRKYLNVAERRRAVEAMAALDTPKALFALTLAWTGARVSEVLALTPASFQIGEGLVAITTLKRRRLSVREVPIPDHLIAALDAAFGLETAQGDPALSHRRLWPWHRSTGWRIIKGVMSDCGLVGRAASPRGFRHGFGVGTLQSGAPLNLVQRWLGHSRIATTAIYANASGPEERALAELFWQAS